MFWEFWCKAGLPGTVGTQLFHLFHEAGFSAPDCRVEYPIDGGSDSPFYEWFTESLRSILPGAKLRAIELVISMRWHSGYEKKLFRTEVAFRLPLWSAASRGNHRRGLGGVYRYPRLSGGNQAAAFERC